MQNGPNWGKSSCHEVASKFFCNQRTRSTPLDPKLMFCCVLYNFSAFGTVWLSYETRCKTGRTGAKVRATKSHWNFSQPTHPINPIGPYTQVLVRFIQFWCILDRLVDLRNSVQNGPNWCKMSCHEVASEFFAMNAPDPPHWTLNSCFGVFVQFWCIWDRLVDLRNSVQYEPNWCKSSCHKVASDFFTTNAPNPPH